MRKILGVVLVLLLAACGSKKKEAGAAGATGGTAGATGGTAGATAGTAAGTAALPPAIAVDEAGARKLLDAWLAAQNSGDFAAYSALYADKLEGIKRVGARTWRFDRTGWLADRQRMFKNPMVVAVKDVEIRGSNVAATIDLVQTFSQGKFKDEGPKHLVLIRGKDGFQIAREEMLRSEVGGAAANAKGSAYVTMSIGGKPHIVIAPEALAAWGSGPIAGPFEEFHKLATQAATGAPMAAAWNAKALKVHTADGKSCDATVGALKLAAGGTPHFGTVQVWDGDEGMSDDGRVWSPAERAREVFGMSDPYLVGELQVTGDCRPVVAVDPAAKAVVFAAQPAAPGDASAAAAIAAFRALPGHKSLQADWASNYDGQGPWESNAAATIFTDGKRRFAAVSAAEGSGCGDFLGELSAIFEDHGGTWKLASDPDQGFMRVDAILDSDGDGKIELIGAMNDFRMVTGHFVPAAAGGFAPALEVSFPNNDCGC